MTDAKLLEDITFFLAIAGYIGLAATAVRVASGRASGQFWRVVVAVIVVHVAMVWTVRYGWQLSQATRNGYAGFLVFHGALIMIAGSLLAPMRTATSLIQAAFAIVTVGAIGAVFRAPEVAIYRIPVLATAAAGLVGLTRAHWSRHR